MKGYLLLSLALLLLVLPGCAGIRAEGQVCFTPEFLRFVPWIGASPDMTTERCVGGRIGGTVLTPPPTPTEPPPPPPK